MGISCNGSHPPNVCSRAGPESFACKLQNWRCQIKVIGSPKIAERPASVNELTPLGQGGGAIELEMLAAVEVAFLIEVIVN